MMPETPLMAVSCNARAKVVDMYSILGVVLGLSLVWGWISLPGIWQVLVVLFGAGLAIFAGTGFWCLTPLGLSPQAAVAAGVIGWISLCVSYAWTHSAASASR